MRRNCCWSQSGADWQTIEQAGDGNGDELEDNDDSCKERQIRKSSTRIEEGTVTIRYILLKTIVFLIYICRYCFCSIYRSSWLLILLFYGSQLEYIFIYNLFIYLRLSLVSSQITVCNKQAFQLNCLRGSSSSSWSSLL